MAGFGMSALLALWMGCAGSEAVEPEQDDSQEDSAVEDSGAVALPFLFSFAVLADPHISTGAEHQERLAAAVGWINDSAAAESIELVVVVGDIGWGDGLPIARDLLDALEMPYLPIIGDNEIHFGDEQRFDEVFASHYALLSDTFGGWRRGTVEAWNPVHEQTSWFQNTSFEYRGLRWVGLDWCSRDDNSLLSEFAEVHDFAGGTWPFFADELGALGEDGAERGDVLLFSHHPMHLGAFNSAQMADITGLTGPIHQRIAGAWAGHLHLDAEVVVEEGGYTVWVTDATWDDVNTVRLVKVYGDGERFEYDQELIEVPGFGR